MVNIYISAPLSERQRAVKLRNRLRNQRHLVVSTWHNDGVVTPVVGPRVNTLAEACTRAMADFAAIRRCDLFVTLTGTVSVTGRCHVEHGIAVASGKPIIIVGPVANIYHAIPASAQFSGDTEFLAWAAKLLLGGFTKDIADWMSHHGHHA